MEQAEQSNFHFLVLGHKPNAVNYSLKSGKHRHRQMLAFIPGDARPTRPLLQPSSLPACLWGIFPSVLSLASEINTQIQVSWLTRPLHIIALLCLFCSVLQIIHHLHCDTPSSKFGSLSSLKFKKRSSTGSHTSAKHDTTKLKWCFQECYRFMVSLQRSLCSGPIKAFLQFVW